MINHRNPPAAPLRASILLGLLMNPVFLSEAQSTEDHVSSFQCDLMSCLLANGTDCNMRKQYDEDTLPTTHPWASERITNHGGPRKSSFVSGIEFGPENGAMFNITRSYILAQDIDERSRDDLGCAVFFEKTVDAFTDPYMAKEHTKMEDRMKYGCDSAMRGCVKHLSRNLRRIINGSGGKVTCQQLQPAIENDIQRNVLV